MAPRPRPTSPIWSVVASTCQCRPNHYRHASWLIRRTISSSRSTWKPLWRSSWRHPPRAKHASGLASSTAVGAPTSAAPEHLRPLYSAVEKVNEDADLYISPDKLQMVLRCLRTRDPVVRLAVLGLGEHKNPGTLARILLADPLSPREQWEEELETYCSTNRGPVLLRYGTGMDDSVRRQLLKIILIPSSRLKQYNLEILIGSINKTTLGTPDMSATVKPEDIALAPSVEYSFTPDVKLPMARFPVHKAVVVGDAMRDSVALGHFTAGLAPSGWSRALVKTVLELPARPGRANIREDGPMLTMDLELASSALDEFRQSVENASTYEQDWFQSGAPALIEWFAQDMEFHDQPLKPLVRQVVNSVLDEAGQKIALETASRSLDFEAAVIPDEKRHAMKTLLDEWAEAAHTELRDELDAAFASMEWRRLTWWRLFWCLDDVHVVGSAIMQRSWLVQADKRIGWLAGQLDGAGFGAYSDEGLSQPYTSSSPPQQNSPEATMKDGVQHTGGPSALSTSQPATEDALVPKALPASPLPSAPAPLARAHLPPWPPHIEDGRLALSSTITSLQTAGERIVIRSVSITAISYALTAFLYVSFPTLSIYEVGAVAAFGTVWSMGHMQRKWNKARRYWQDTLRIGGRLALLDTEHALETLIEEGGRPTETKEEAAPRSSARDSVASACKALEELGWNDAPSLGSRPSDGDPSVKAEQ